MRGRTFYEGHCVITYLPRSRRYRVVRPWEDTVYVATFAAAVAVARAAIGGRP